MLADLRPNTKMLAELAELMGESPELLQAAGVVEPSWQALRALQAARPVLDGELADVEDLGLRGEFERRHASLLAAHGIEHLNISEIRSRSRTVTQKTGATSTRTATPAWRFTRISTAARASRCSRVAPSSSRSASRYR